MERKPSLAYILYTQHRALLTDNQVVWTPVPRFKPVDGLPQIFWSDGKPWTEANLWARERATSGVSIQTVQSNLLALYGYAIWLENTGTNWTDFPRKKSERCLVRYRGALIERRDNRQLAPSTAKVRMSVAVQFYRWLYASGLVSPVAQMWNEREIGVHLTDRFGLERTLRVRTTDLAIPNRKAHGERLEDGLLPVSIMDRDSILAFAATHASEELALMLTVGFFTGMRIGTIADLRIQTLDRAAPDPANPGLFRLAVGPGAHPPVHTKGGVNGQTYITGSLLEALKTYFYSARRLRRQALADDGDRDLVFLTARGHRYAHHRSNKGSAINVQLHALRKLGAKHHIKALRNFHFHQSRATFATELARLALSHSDAILAIEFVRDALLHKNEATSLLYIKFVQKEPIKALVADEFSTAFLGLIKSPTVPDDDSVTDGPTEPEHELPRAA